MVRRMLAAALAAFVLSAGPAVRAAGPSAIIPGEALGPIRIGMPLTEARALLEAIGPVEPSDDADGAGWCNTDRSIHGFCVWDNWLYDDDASATRTEGKVLAITTHDRAYHVGGLRVGGSADGLRGMMGAPDDIFRVDPFTLVLEWWTRGIAVAVRADGTIVTIAIFAPRAQRPI